MYVYIDIYTLQLCIIDLTQRGCHTLRSTVRNLFSPGLRNPDLSNAQKEAVYAVKHRLWKICLGE